MTRAKDNAGARTPRAGNKAAARAKAAKAAAAGLRRTASVAALRLQVCAGVFARSRIHFDASRGASRGIVATDVADALATAFADPSDEHAAPRAPLRRREEFTIH